MVALMKIDLLKPFDQIPYFTLTGIKQILDFEQTDDQYARELVHRWKKAGHIITLKKGVYTTRHFFEAHCNDQEFSAAVSAILMPQSYISLEYILQQSGVLTEVTYPITAVTLKNTRTIKNIVGTFDYHHIKPTLYIGFSPQIYFNIIIHRATMAKALFDFFYFRPLPRAFRTKRLDLSEDLRLNLEVFSHESWNEFHEFVRTSESEKMGFIMENLQRRV